MTMMIAEFSVESTTPMSSRESVSMPPGLREAMSRIAMDASAPIDAPR